MRFFTFDKFNTWYDWRLTLTAKDVTPPELKTNYIALDGANGTLDLSEALTGEMAYNDRTVTASFWTSEGTFQERVVLCRDIIAALHGKKIQIIEPDDPEHYFLGRVRVKSQTFDQVHAELVIEAVCDPWRYAVEETERTVKVDGEQVGVVLRNDGVRTICPDLLVTGEVELAFNGTTVTLGAGAYKLTDLKLKQGLNVVHLDGSGSVTFIYREAGL
jgi:hypothetical protein